MELSCIILAGGKSKRLGRNKVAEIVGNKNLLERAVCCLSSFDSEIIIVKAQDSLLPEIPAFPKLKVVEDIYPGKGSLGGVYTGLKMSDSLLNLVVACDMPFFNIDLLRYLIKLANDFDVVLPQVNDEMLEPLHAVYSRNCIIHMEYLINHGILSFLELFPMVNVRYVKEAEIAKIDPEHLSFFNINTEHDLSLGKDLVSKKDSEYD